MRAATELEIGIWRLRQAGLSYSEIAVRAGTTKGTVGGILKRIRDKQVALPAARVVTHGCRWVLGEPNRPGWSWCDAPAIAGSAWCAEHRQRVYAPRKAA